VNEASAIVTNQPDDAASSHPYGSGAWLHGLPAGLVGRTLLAGFVWPENGSG